MARELFKPSEAGKRDPTSNAQVNGRVINPPRYAPLGGLSSAGKAFSKNGFNIVKPGGAK